MCQVQDWVEVRRLFDGEDLTGVRIAEALGVTCNAVTRFPRLSEGPRMSVCW